MSEAGQPRDALRIPSGLREWSREHGSPAQQSWLSNLTDAVAGYASRWRLSLGEPFEPGGTSAWVAAARDETGAPVALKVAWAHDESRDEAAGLVLLDGRGTIRVHAHEAIGDTVAMVLELCEPGTPLSGEPLDVQHREIARILGEVRSAPVPADHALRPLADMCDDWAGAAADRYRYTDVVIDPGLLAAGLELFRELPRSAASNTLLLTDLHAGNVLAAAREPWLAIDPKPYVGDPHYDVIQHLLNCPDLEHSPRDLIAQVAAANDLDRARVTEWLFSRCVIEGAEWPQLLAVAREIAP